MEDIAWGGGRGVCVVVYTQEMGGGGIPGTSPCCLACSRPTHILLGVHSVVSTIADFGHGL